MPELAGFVLPNAVALAAEERYEGAWEATLHPDLLGSTDTSFVPVRTHECEAFTDAVHRIGGEVTGQYRAVSGLTTVPCRLPGTLTVPTAGDVQPLRALGPWPRSPLAEPAVRTSPGERKVYPRSPRQSGRRGVKGRHGPRTSTSTSSDRVDGGAPRRRLRYDGRGAEAEGLRGARPPRRHAPSTRGPRRRRGGDQARHLDAPGGRPRSPSTRWSRAGWPRRRSASPRRDPGEGPPGEVRRGRRRVRLHRGRLVDEGARQGVDARDRRSRVAYRRLKQASRSVSDGSGRLGPEVLGRRRPAYAAEPPVKAHV